VKEIRDKLKDIEDKLDEHTKILASVDKTLALQAQQLEQHMLRTNLAEENLQMLREEFKPVEGHVEFVNKLSKLIALMVAAASAFFGAIEVVKWLISVL
jgi:chromosome segregation ATPase